MYRCKKEDFPTQTMEIFFRPTVYSGEILYLKVWPNKTGVTVSQPAHVE